MTSEDEKLLAMGKLAAELASTTGHSIQDAMESLMKASASQGIKDHADTVAFWQCIALAYWLMWLFQFCLMIAVLIR